jgi:hypothetical protein
MTDEYWVKLFDADKKTYTCPWCKRELKSKISNSAKNPGKSFVSCSKDYGGCGLFCFLNEQPNDKFKPAGGDGAPLAFKRARAEGTNVVGPIAAAPNAVEQRVADLAVEVAALRAAIARVDDYIRQVNE